MKKEVIGVIILFIVMTAFIILVGELYLKHFPESGTIDKMLFGKVIGKAFLQALVIDGGIIALYFINKKRVRQGKKPI